MEGGLIALTSLDTTKIGSAIGLSTVEAQLAAAPAQLTAAAAAIVNAQTILAQLTANTATLQTDINNVQTLVNTTLTNANNLSTSANTSLTTSQTILTNSQTNQTNVTNITNAVVPSVVFTNSRIIAWAGNGTAATPAIPSVFSISSTQTWTFTAGAFSLQVPVTLIKLGNIVSAILQAPPSVTVTIPTGTTPTLAGPCPAAYQPDASLITTSLERPMPFVVDTISYQTAAVLVPSGGNTMTITFARNQSSAPLPGGGLGLYSFVLQWLAVPGT